MTICACLKPDGKQCTREVSTKAGTNHNFCWQHQNCKNIKSNIADIPKPIILPISSPKKEIKVPLPEDTKSPSTDGFKVDGPIIVGSNIYILYALYKHTDEPINKINLAHGSYRLISDEKFTTLSHNSIDPNVVKGLVEQIKLHNPVPNSQIFGYKEYGGILQSLLDKKSYSFDVQTKKVFGELKIVFMAADYYASLKSVPEKNIIDIIPMPRSKNLCYIDTKQIVCYGFHYLNIVLVDNKILICYDQYNSQYNSHFLKMDDKGQYYKPSDYDANVTKSDYIEKIIDDKHIDELIEKLDISLTDLVQKEMNKFSLEELKAMFDDN